MRLARLAPVVVATFLLAGCGGDSDSADTSTDDATTTTEAAAGGGAPAVEKKSLTCTGGSVSAVTVANDASAPTAVAVSWTGTTTGTEFVSYIVTLTSADGKMRQVAQKRFPSGEVTQFVYDMGTLQQTNLDRPDPGPDALTFPGALDGFGGSWKATGVVSVDGQDVITCE